MKPETLDQEARRLRDLVFCRHISDDEWAQCGASWRRDIGFLRDWAAKQGHRLALRPKLLDQAKCALDNNDCCG